MCAHGLFGCWVEQEDKYSVKTVKDLAARLSHSKIVNLSTNSSINLKAHSFQYFLSPVLFEIVFHNINSTQEIILPILSLLILY